LYWQKDSGVKEQGISGRDLTRKGGGEEGRGRDVVCILLLFILQIRIMFNVYKKCHKLELCRS